MIIVTGAAGFIGSVVAGLLQKEGFQDLVLVDDFSQGHKEANWKVRADLPQIDRNGLEQRLLEGKLQPAAIIHLGARTDTAELDWSIFQRLNLDYSKMIWEYCCQQQIPLIYASSAATYGGGELGFEDTLADLDALKPLNPYGQSKHLFDQWAMGQTPSPPFWAGLKFFNVYGPNEYHKGRMASVFFHAFRQIQAQGFLKLFRSHREDIADGEQSRDFVYVKDLAQVMLWLLRNRPESGLYNLGTGTARSFNDLGKSVFAAMGLEPDIRYIDTPIDIRESYQYYTCANMEKLRRAGYDQPFTAIEEGAADYIKHFLSEGVIF